MRRIPQNLARVEASQIRSALIHHKLDLSISVKSSFSIRASVPKRFCFYVFGCEYIKSDEIDVHGVVPMRGEGCVRMNICQASFRCSVPTTREKSP